MRSKKPVFLVVILIKSRVALCARTLKLVSCCHLIFFTRCPGVGGS